MRKYYKVLESYYITENPEGGNFFYNPSFSDDLGWMEGFLRISDFEKLTPVSRLELRLRGIPEYD